MNPTSDIRDLLSYRLAHMTSLNDRSGHAHISEAFGVTLGDWRALGNIEARTPLTLSELARAMLIDKGQLSRTVAGLVERGWVLEKQSAADRRTAALSLSAEGRRQHSRIMAFARERNAVVTGVLTTREKRELDRILVKLTTFVEAEHAALARGSAQAAEQTASATVTGRAAP